jgi:hypothetical protein
LVELRGINASDERHRIRVERRRAFGARPRVGIEMTGDPVRATRRGNVERAPTGDARGDRVLVALGHDGRVVHEHLDTKPTQARTTLIASDVELMRDDVKLLTAKDLCGDLSLIEVAGSEDDAIAEPCELSGGLETEPPVGSADKRDPDAHSRSPKRQARAWVTSNGPAFANVPRQHASGCRLSGGCDLR